MSDKEKEILDEDADVIVEMTDEEGNSYYYREEMIIPVGDDKFALLIGIDATRREHSLGVGCRAVAAAFVQLLGYGSGYLRAWWQCRVLHSGEFEAFSDSFYQ